MESDCWEDDEGWDESLDNQEYDHHQVVLDFCPPPDGDYELVSYFMALTNHPEVFIREDMLGTFVAGFGKKRYGEGRTPAEAIRNCLMPNQLF